MIARVLLTVALAFTQVPPDTGRVIGTVKLTMATSGKSTARAYDTRSIAPRAKPLPESRNVIIFFDGVEAPDELETAKAALAQKDEQFVPHVAAITRGSAVSFPNDDPFFHNVFSLSKAKTFDLGRYPSGTSRSEVFNQPGVVKVFCHLHSHMTALIMVFDHPWFAIPAESGAFTLPPLPARELTVVAWHERIGERRERVMLAPGATVRMSFTLPVLESEP